MPKYLDESGIAYLWKKLKHDFNNRMVYYSKKKNEWDADRDIIAEKDALYIYSDYKTIQKDGQQILIPGLKIGDGVSYLIDIPFVNDNSEFEDLLLDHINNRIIHVSLSDRDFWNNKLNLVDLVDLQDENLILNRE